MEKTKFIVTDFMQTPSGNCVGWIDNKGGKCWSKIHGSAYNQIRKGDAIEITRNENTINHDTVQIKLNGQIIYP